MLLGLIREEQGVASRMLRDRSVQLGAARAAVERIVGRGDHASDGPIGLTPRAKRVIELAVDEARQFKHNYIGTEHLLLGLVREGEGVAVKVLDPLGARTSVTAMRGQLTGILRRTRGRHGS